MKRVLHILNTGSFAGAENVAISIIQNTAKETESVYLSLDGTIGDVLTQYGIAFYPVPTLTVGSIKKAIKDIKPDIIHAHDFTAGVFSAFATFKIPIINHLHNGAPWRKNLNLKTALYGVASFRFKKILTVSSSVMDEFIFGKLLNKKVLVIGNPIDRDKIVRQASVKYDEAYDVAFLGRLKDEKNPQLFIDIINEIYNKKPEIKAVMIGDGELKPFLQEKIRELKMENSISLKGFVENPFSILKNSRVLCMPSKWEGFGLSAVEGLCLELPVVASAVGGLTDLIDDSCGKLCGEKSQYAEEIVKLLDDREYYKQKSQGAALRANRLDNIKEYTKNILKIYSKL